MNSLDIRFKDIKKTGATLDALVNAGANQISGPSFSIDNPDALLDTARRAAVKKAQDRAHLYATALGTTIKRVISMTEGDTRGSMPPPMPMAKMAYEMAAAPAVADTSVAPGQLSLRASVTIRYELGE
jgi:uncharacterized protein YggE